MENKEAIEWLKGSVVSYEVDNKGKPNGNITCELTQEVLDMAISALEKQEQDRWIPVTERLPELTHFMYDVTPFSDTVLVTMRNQYGAERLVLGDYEQRKGWNFELLNSTDERFQWHAIAWRPLPKPYTEEEHDKP